MNGQLVCITGIDGAGKSTQAQRLVARLRQEGYRARYVWGGRRAVLTAPLVRGGKRMLHAPKRPTTGMPQVNGAYRSYVAGARQRLRAPAVQALWRWLAMAEHASQLATRVELPLLRGEIVVCDRYLYDTLVSQTALLGGSPWQLTQALHSLLGHLAPRPTLGFWLNLAPGVAATRKTDIYDIEQLSTRAPLYATLAYTFGFTQLDASRDPDMLAEAIWQATSQMLARSAHQKTLSIQH